MSLRILCDENIPGAIVLFLKEKGWDVVRVEGGSPDPEIANQARREKRILLTFDSDFANILTYPPGDYFGIVRLNISPPFIDIVIRAIKNMFEEFKSQEDFRGKLIIVEASRFRVWEEKYPT